MLTAVVGKWEDSDMAPTLEFVPPLPDLTAIARLYLENYAALTDEDRKIYRKLILELMNPQMVANFDAVEMDKLEARK